MIGVVRAITAIFSRVFFCSKESPVKEKKTGLKDLVLDSDISDMRKEQDKKPKKIKYPQKGEKSEGTPLAELLKDVDRRLDAKSSKKVVEKSDGEKSAGEKGDGESQKKVKDKSRHDKDKPKHDKHKHKKDKHKSKDKSKKDKNNTAEKEGKERALNFKHGRSNLYKNSFISSSLSLAKSEQSTSAKEEKIENLSLASDMKSEHARKSNSETNSSDSVSSKADVKSETGKKSKIDRKSSHVRKVEEAAPVTIHDTIKDFLRSKTELSDSSTGATCSETEVSCAIDFHDKKAYNRLLSKKMIAFLKLRQHDIKKK